MRTIKKYKKHNSSSFRNKHSKSVKKIFIKINTLLKVNIKNIVEEFIHHI